MSGFHDSSGLDWRHNFRVSHPGNECPIVQAQVDESAVFERSSRCPKCETEGHMIGLAEVMACYDRSKNQIEQSEGAVFCPDRRFSAPEIIDDK